MFPCPPPPTLNLQTKSTIRHWGLQNVTGHDLSLELLSKEGKGTNRKPPS